MSKHRRPTHHQRAGFPRANPATPVVATGATEEKANPAFAGVTIINDVPQPHSMPRNYRSYADQGYAANDSVFKCVNYIAANGAAIPPRLYTDATMETEIPAHPLLDRLARPNMEQDGVTFREAVLGWYLIAGNAFLYAIRPGKTQGPPDELWVLDANKVKPLPSPTRGIVSYQFDDFDSSQNPIPAANIAHLRTWNPKDPIFGISPIEVGALMIDQQNAARKWNLALMQNMAKPSGAWVTDAALAKPERDRLEERLNEKLAGARNAGKVPVIDAGAKWVATSVPPSELDWLKSIQYNAGQIANLYNIPPQLIGDTSASTYNNMEQAKAASYTEAIFPALDKLYALLGMWLLPMYPDLCDAKGQPKAHLSYAKDTVEVIQNVLQAQATAEADRAVKAYVAGAITLNQAQAMQGLPDLGPRGEVYRVGLVLIPADQLDKYAAQSLTEPAKPPKPIPEPLTGVPPASANPANPAEPPAPAAPVDDADPGGDDQNANQAASQKAWLARAARHKKAWLRRERKSGGADTTHLAWECQPSACDFCLQNDGAVVADGDPFPNGCYTPDDCHRFCECSATELAVPDDVSADDVAGMSTDSLIALYAVGYLASRHERDVAAQAAADAEAQSGDAGEDDESEDDGTEPVYAAPASPRKKPKKRRREYRRWMEEVL